MGRVAVVCASARLYKQGVIVQVCRSTGPAISSNGLQVGKNSHRERHLQA